MKQDQFRSALTANDRYQVLMDQSVALSDLERVFSLYLPFIGNDGYVLYHFLVTEGQADSQPNQDHNLILDSLNLSLPALVSSQRRLEAAGLLKTFYQEQGTGGYTYQVQAPLSAAAFFNEALLAGLLYKFVGEERFQTLHNRYQPSAQIPSGTEVSAKFLQVFEPSNSPISTQALAETANQPAVDTAGFHFDFDAFVSLVQGSSQPALDKQRRFLVGQALLYGLNEQQLAQAVTRTVRLDDHQVDQMALQRYLKATYGQQQVPETKDSQADPAKNQEQDSTGAKPQVSEALQRLYQAANQLAPLPFLSQLKANQHGFVSNSERRLLTDLIDQNILPVPVINILTYQVIVGMGNASLNRNLVDAIANAWAKNQVKTPAEAVAQIKAHQAGGQQNRSSGQNRRYQRATKVEPNLAKRDQAQAPKHDASEVQAALARLKELKTKN
ncbi:DnaD domain protein [Leuconostocaceae bacterium ESL0723]|nr:DnaD domain protein [Leuconostocaceae bacterium ESL0723]